MWASMQEKEKKMIRISSDVAAFVRSRFPGAYIVITSRTKNSRGKTYYVEENPRILNAIQRRRNENVLYSRGLGREKTNKKK